MIEKKYDGYVYSYDVNCDLCSYHKEYIDVYDWDELIDRIKKEGWTIEYKDGEFEHRCPICSHKA
ncbi:unnamed protein product [marine sediment metagenome]|uniref:Uncharacterized protein n=1 Tax=marine sediment metagenome TaxID=412755 RepID=X0WKR1_9ZZZZ